MQVGVVGAGSWGTAMAKLIGEQETVFIWDIQPDVLEEIDKGGKNPRYLPEVELPASVRTCEEFQQLVEKAELLVLAVPSHSFRGIVEQLVELPADDLNLLVLSKGFDPGSGGRLSEVYRDLHGSLNNYYLLSGPSHASEVAEERPTTVALGGGNRKGRENLQEFLFRDYFRVYTNEDLIGLEMGGALKNIIAIAAGIADGLGFGVNARAALITRGMNDLREVAEYEGARKRTLYGLSGLGDLIVTATSELSRNYRCGQALAAGKGLEEAKEEIGQVIEGVNSTRLAMERVRTGNLRAPLFEAVEAVLAGEISPMKAVNKLMTRKAKAEFTRDN